MHMPIPHKPLVSLLLFAPLLAAAQDRPCEHAHPRDLKLDMLASITTAVIEICSQRQDVVARPGAPTAIQGRVCAADTNALESLKLEQSSFGGNRYVTARRHRPWMGPFTSPDYACMTQSAPGARPWTDGPDDPRPVSWRHGWQRRTALNDRHPPRKTT